MQKKLYHFHAYLTEKEHREYVKFINRVKENALPEYVKTGTINAKLIKAARIKKWSK